MTNLEHLNPKKVETVAIGLWKVSSSLNGLGSLFLYQSSASCLDSDEYAGIGCLLQELSGEISRLEDILRCGHDSASKTEADEISEKPS
ncbi:MAG: hypothetical protein VXV96_08330 [Bdellovibrionota bacterium]|nr:hypothetical protein [Bdellovibrionota bacterium]